MTHAELDLDLHLGHEELERGLRSLPPPPRDSGTVVLVVSRPDSSERRAPQRCRLSPENGVEGDRWSQKPDPDRASQVTMMRADVAQLFANGRPLSLFGDNLVVELDLSEENLPAGTQLRIGTTLCEVTPKPHTGCGKFARRVGAEARAITAAEQWVRHRLRGIHVRVLEAGEVSPGDRIEVVARSCGKAPA